MRRPKAKIRERDRRRGVVACVVLSAVLAAGILAGGYAARPAPPESATATALSRSQELRYGAILYVPIEGNVCRIRLLDNASWLTRAGGTVVCDDAVSWNSGLEGQKYFVAVRMESIRAGFRR